MIFVTVGTMDFESLIKTVDQCAPNFNETFVCQIGNNIHTPKNCEYFRFKDTLEPYYKDAALIITHGGAGTLYRALELGKIIIGVDNFGSTDAHQQDILKKLAENRYLIWCNDLKKLEKLINDYPTYKFKRYQKPECLIANTIKDFIGGKCV
jgi:beta-1,4-N-acetylglucosaminyltransferase